MEWFVAVVIIAALGAAAVAASGGLGAMTKEPVRDVYRQDLPDDRPLGANDINGLRFGTAFRGYAMDQVDDVLDRLGREIAERDEVIAQLRATQAAPPDDERVERAEGGLAWPGAPAFVHEPVRDPHSIPDPDSVADTGSALEPDPTFAPEPDRESAAEVSPDYR